MLLQSPRKLSLSLLCPPTCCPLRSAVSRLDSRGCCDDWCEAAFIWLATKATNDSCTGHMRSRRYVGGVAHCFHTIGWGMRLCQRWGSTWLLYKETVYVLFLYPFSHSFLACFSGWEASLLCSALTWIPLPFFSTVYFLGLCLKINS